MNIYKERKEEAEVKDITFIVLFVLLALTSTSVGYATSSFAWGFAMFFGGAFMSLFFTWLGRDIVEEQSYKQARLGKSKEDNEADPVHNK